MSVPLHHHALKDNFRFEFGDNCPPVDKMSPAPDERSVTKVCFSVRGGELWPIGRPLSDERCRARGVSGRRCHTLGIDGAESQELWRDVSLQLAGVP